MQPGKITLLCLILLLGFSVFGQQEELRRNKIDRFLDFLESGNEFTGGILVARNDSLLINRAYGFAEKSFEVPNRTDTQYGIASIGKMITSVAILQLYEKGEIDLHKTVGNYLKDYPNISVRDSVTIHHLLTHTAGTNNAYDDEFLETSKSAYRSLRDYMPLFVNDELLFSPGTDYAYSNTGFMILGLIIEAVSHQPYYDFVEKNIFQPAGMTHTNPSDLDAIVPNRATGYMYPDKIGDAFTSSIYYSGKATSAGGYFSTVEDLFAFSKALMNYRLLSKTTTDLMLQPKVKGYNTMLGYGIDIDSHNGHPIVGHTGGWYGIRGELMMYPSTGYTIVLLSNVGDNGYEICSRFFKTLLTGTAEETAQYEWTHALIQQTLSDGLEPALKAFQEQKEKITPDEAMIHSFAYNQLYHQDIENGLNLLRLNARVFPSSLNALSNLAETCNILDRKKEALANYKLALALEPDNEKWQKAISTIQDALKDK